MCRALPVHMSMFLRAPQQVPSRTPPCIFKVFNNVSLPQAHTYQEVFSSKLCCAAGVTIQAPQLDINTVAAGGGSRLFFRTGVFQVCY